MTSRRISPLRALLVILSLLLPASLSLGSAASAAGNADFRGHWLDSSCGWVITSEDFGSGAVTGTSDCTQFELTDGHVSGNSYSFTVTDGSYFSYNTGTFTSTTAIGHFNDTYGHSIDYTASRANGPSSTTVSCVPDAAGGAVDTCTVTVTTQPVDPTVTPTGTVRPDQHRQRRLLRRLVHAGSSDTGNGDLHGPVRPAGRDAGGHLASGGHRDLGRRRPAGHKCWHDDDPVRCALRRRGRHRLLGDQLPLRRHPRPGAAHQRRRDPRHCDQRS